MSQQNSSLIHARRNYLTTSFQSFLGLVVVMSLLAPGNLLAKVHNLCPSISTLALNTTARWTALGRFGDSSDLLQCYEITVPSAGALFLDLSIPGSPTTEPRLFVAPSISGQHQLVWETPRGGIINVKAPGTLLITVLVETAMGTTRPLESPLAYKLRNAFISEDRLPTEEVFFNEDLPDSCAEESLEMVPQPFTQSTVVTLTEVDEDDCDVMTLTSDVPGVVFIESPETLLHAALYSATSCTGQSLLAEGLLDGESGPVVAPLHASGLRMTLDPVTDSTGEPRPRIRFFAPCGLGETDDHGDTPLCATPLAAGGLVDGVVENSVGDDEDFFTFVLDQQRTVNLEVIEGEGVKVALYDEHLRELALGLNGETTLHLVRILPPGRYYLGIEPGKDFEVTEKYTMYFEILD